MSIQAAQKIGERRIPPFAIMPADGQPHAISRKGTGSGQIVVLRPSEDLLSGGNVPRPEAVLALQTDLDQLAEKGVNEGWHLEFMKTGFTRKIWITTHGESFEVSVARRQFAIMKEAFTAQNHEAARRQAFLARRAASAAGIKTPEALARKLKIDPTDWKKITGAPYEPLKGHWETIGRYETAPNKMKAIRSFRLDQPVGVLPNCALG